MMVRRSFEIEWRQHPYHEHIAVSEFGDILSYKSGRWYELKPSDNGTGYIRVGIGHSNPTYVHILVAETYLESRSGEVEVNHRDGVKSNNHYSNLEWVTQSENEIHAHKHGLKVAWNRAAVRIVETGEVFDSVRECARHIKGQQANISKCLSGERHTHLGYTFEYI